MASLLCRWFFTRFWSPSTGNRLRSSASHLKLLILNWRRVTPFLFSTERLSQVAFVAGLEAPSETTRQESQSGISTVELVQIQKPSSWVYGPQSQSGISTVELVQIQKPSSWVYGPHSLSLPFGLSTTYTSMATRELLLTG
uniref:Uncharacterized protein n=1 Tax=Picea glauca TaxID=3330 RepID=A0A101LU03_PICGL|nr:hypothetical protein ABT39_MTgene3633 [Picea glauca]